MGFVGALRYCLERFNATVINDLWPELWFFTLWSVMVCLVNTHTDIKFFISNQMLTVLGTVLGLVISFRTTSAYDRYWEGRKLWGNIQLASRNLAMIIWIHVPLDRRTSERRPESSRPESSRPDGRIRAIIERKTMLNLVQAFSVSVKHYLRSEPGIYYEDLYPLLSFLPRNIANDSEHPPTEEQDPAKDWNQVGDLPMWYDSTNATFRNKQPKKHHHRPGFRPEKVLSDIACPVTLRPARNPPSLGLIDTIPFLIVFKPFGALFRKLTKKSAPPTEEIGTRGYLGKKKEPPPTDSNVALESELIFWSSVVHIRLVELNQYCADPTVTLFLSSYLQMLLSQELLTSAMATGFNNALVSMQDALVNLERIRTTPIPFAYQTHLRMSIWLYLIFLPFEVYQAFKWLTVPCVIFAAFLYLGFLEIGQEIENPFNYDENDLDLDHFCLTIQRELAEITAHPTFDPSTFIFSPRNQPFAPADRRTATDILAERQSHEEGHPEEKVIFGVREVLLKSYGEIIKATHHDTQRNSWFKE
ncbi:hypothetical protein FRB94_005296 [Tulasnella sp. JGI-2019a]|nr:hypothetical protein FRB94_005296 [Tulasnella sp. JGI-2019a]KAG9016167.1 hypothetical protein FRB93_011641 [Tulasnella sp. JGI-2019a]